MANLVDAIRWSRAEPEDVIVSLDGDNWSPVPTRRRQYAEASEQFDCWVTYGSWLTVKLAPSGQPHGPWPAYPDGTVDSAANRSSGRPYAPGSGGCGITFEMRICETRAATTSGCRKTSW